MLKPNLLWFICLAIMLMAAYGVRRNRQDRELVLSVCGIYLIGSGVLMALACLHL